MPNGTPTPGFETIEAVEQFLRDLSAVPVSAGAGFHVFAQAADRLELLRYEVEHVKQDEMAMMRGNPEKLGDILGRVFTQFGK